MTSITVTTQEELDDALSKHKNDPTAEIIIDSPHGAWLDVSAYGSATVRAYGSATVRAYGSATVRAYGSATVSAYGSATVSAYGSATVRAYGSATVSAYGSATVRAYGSATVSAYDSATVSAYGSATVSAYGSATVSAYDSATVSAYDSATVRATPFVAVHLHSARVSVEGGVVIDITKLDRTNWRTWADYWGVEISGDELIVYKAVDANLKSGRGFAYPIGETVEAPDWKAGDFCGSGLHLSPRPTHALQYFREATRYLECAVNVGEIAVINGNGVDTPKLKAKRVRVLREVTLDGDAVNSKVQK
ncbi:hypothetical protein [Microbacterium sp.]|uniref:DUF7666 domain-containing protein n=1 Tax=Microbacterium sp. TaxID=51671 RepID=UPI003242A3F2